MFHNIYKALQNRGMNGAEDSIKSWGKKKNIDDNIRHDNHSLKKISLNSCPKSFSRSNELVAVLDTNDELALYNVSNQQKLWSITVQDLEDYSDNRLVVSDSGLVLYLSQELEVAIDTNKLYIQCYLNGKKISAFMLQALDYSQSIRIINNRIFGASAREGKFCEWNMQGELIRSMKIDNPRRTLTPEITISENYYIVSFIQQGYFNIFPIFIFDLSNNEYKTINLFQNENVDIKYLVHAITVFNNNLVISYRQQNLISSANLEIAKMQKIKFIDIETEKNIQEYNFQNIMGIIGNLTVNHRYIIYSTRYFGLGNLHIVDIENNATTTMIDLPDWGDYHKLLQIILTDALLVLCYEKGNFQEKNEKSTVFTIDLETKKVIQQRNYGHYAYEKPSFSSGLFVCPKSIDNANENAIYVEDYNDEPLRDDESKNSIRLGF